MSTLSPVKLRQVTLKNLRCYRKLTTVEFNDITDLVGRNDAGKSAWPRALNVFFGNAKVRPFMIRSLSLLAALACAWSANVFAHPEELVESFEQQKDAPRAMPKEIDRFGAPLWEIDARVPFVGSPVHEKLTVEAVTLSQVHGRPYKLDYDDAYIRGAFWNDDPDDLLCPQCSTLNLLKFDRRWGIAFALRFDRAKQRAHGENGAPPYFFSGADGLLERSHFGDLQFLHGMAARDGEPAIETQRKILMWAEFTYRVATGELDQRTLMQNVSIDGIRDLFAANSRVSALRIEQLFRGSRHAKRVAVGSLLHIIQDSYALGHAQREVLDTAMPDGSDTFSRGTVHEFHCYTNQDPDKHRMDDKWPDGFASWQLGTDDNPISIGAKVLQFIYANEGRGAPWQGVESYLRNVVFRIADNATSASPGTKYRLRLPNALEDRK